MTKFSTFYQKEANQSIGILGTTINYVDNVARFKVAGLCQTSKSAFHSRLHQQQYKQVSHDVIEKL
jgi:hypothetical protein